MGSFSRKLLPDPLNDTLSELCSPFCDLSQDLGYCQPPCITFCYTFCPYKLSPPPTSLNHPHNHPNKLLVTFLSILAAVVVLVTCYALYVKFYKNPSRRRRSLVDGRNETREEFFDEDHGPVVDHPIWHINTVGLQPSIISSITVCRFKKGDGLVEGTECAVCLNEFQEDETLRLLPKCSHAFHIPCIDAWLRAHTNCPLCRAPVVVSTARAASSEGGVGDGGAGEGIRIEVSENDGGSDGELIRSGREEGGELVEGQDNRGLSAGEDSVQPIRRSVSLDSLSALKIGMAMANVPPMGSDWNSDTRLGGETDSGMDLPSKRDGGRQSLLKLMASSSSSTSTARSFQAGSSSSSVKRSFSCSGKLFPARDSQSRISFLPL